MNNLKYYLGLLGFLFVAAWIALSFGDAVLCLIGAIGFYAIGAVLEGDVDLGEMQTRMQRSRSAPR